MMTAGMDLESIKQLIKSSRVAQFLWDTLGLPFVWGVLSKNDIIRDTLYGMGLRLVPESILYFNFYPPEQQMAQRLLTQIHNIHELSKSYGVPMVLLIIPFREQITHYKFTPYDYLDYGQPNHLLRDFAQREGIEVIDLLDAYDQLDLPAVAKLYFTHDLHWTELGHQHAAALIAEYFKKQLAK